VGERDVGGRAPKSGDDGAAGESPPATPAAAPLLPPPPRPSADAATTLEGEAPPGAGQGTARLPMLLL